MILRFVVSFRRPPPMPTTIAVAQIDIAFADRERNLARMIQVLEETAAKGAALTIFPEAALAGYCFDSLAEARPHAEPIPGPSTQRMTEICRKLKTCAVYGLLEADGDCVFNACVLVGPEGVVGSYRKIHLPFLGVDRFTHGRRPCAVHESAGCGSAIISATTALPESAV
jgi:predicted amidohydrolase